MTYQAVMHDMLDQSNTEVGHRSKHSQLLRQLTVTKPLIPLLV